ncbi:MAG: ABC transporter permease [Peptococcaceae bacterium]|nr:ABC transporter permease [Peptococcaceae bacterium]
MKSLNYILKRILQMIPVFLIVTVLVFLLIRLIPGDPARVLLGERATPEAVAAKQIAMGLDKPLITQYWIFLQGLFHFNFGDSLQYRIPVMELLKGKILVTVMLTVVSSVFSILLSLTLGYLAGANKDKMPDQVVRMFSLLGLSTPTFWVGMVLLIIFGVNLKWFPVSGWGTSWGQHIKSLILPGITMAISVSALMVRNLRNSVVDVKNQDFVAFAVSKGLSEWRISLRHVIRNAMIPTVTLFALKVIYMLGGTVVIETVFTLPGVGALLVNSILSRDYAVVQCVVLLFVLVVAAINLLTDILYSVLDPRVKLQ